MSSQLKDIRETGSQDHADIRKQNDYIQSGSNPPDNEVPWYDLPLTQRLQYTQNYNRNLLPVENLNYEQASQLGDLGKSKYDKDVPTYAINNLEDWRGMNQSTASKWAHGLTKGVALAGTTFLDGTIGLLYGVPAMLGTWAMGGSFMDGLSQIWANDLSNALQNINDKMEEWLPNYRTQSEQEKEWWQNIGTANFWADGFFKNLGFTVGAFYSGNAWLKGLKALKFVKTGASAEVVGSLLSGFNEGRIEANNAQREFIDEQNGFADFKRLQLADEIKGDPSLTDDQKIQKLKALDDNLNKRKKEIVDKSHGVGLAVLIANTALLTADNMIQFGKLYRRGFDNTKSFMQSLSSGIEKKGIVGSIKDGGKLIAEELTKPEAYARGVRNAATEGFEEMNQLSIANFAKHWQGGDSPDSYHLALINPKAKIQSDNFISALARGIADSYGNKDNWEEFAIGFLTGAIGMPTFGSANNSDANTWLKLGKFGISGGIIGESRSALEESKQNVEDAEAMNKYLDKIRENEHYFAQSQSFTNAMDGFAAADDKFEYNNMEDNDNWAAMTRFARRGRLDELLDMINQDFDNISDEQLEQIALHTTPGLRLNKDGDVEYEDVNGNTEKGGWRDSQGRLMSDTPEGRAEMREKLKAKRDKIIESIKQYKKSIDVVRNLNLGLDEDQINELAWLHWKPNMFQNRYESVTSNDKEDIIRLKTAIDKVIEDHETEKANLKRSEEEKGTNAGRKKNAERSRMKRAYGENVMFNNLKTVSEFLSHLLSTDSALQFGSIINNNPSIMSVFKQLQSRKTNESVDDWNKRVGEINPTSAMLEELWGKDSQSYKEFIRDLHDTARIGLLAKQFNEKFKEFSENPGKLAENRNKINKAKEKVNKFVKKQKAKRDINNKSIQDIIDNIQNGDLNEETIESLKGTPAGNMIETAQEIIKKKDDIRSEIIHSDADDKDKSVMEAALDAARGDNVDEIIKSFFNEVEDPQNAREQFDGEDIPNALSRIQEQLKEFRSLHEPEDVSSTISKATKGMPTPERKDSSKGGVDPQDNQSVQEEEKQFDEAQKKFENSPEQIANRDSKIIADELQKIYNERYEGQYEMSDDSKESHRQDIEDYLNEILKTYNDGKTYEEAVAELDAILDDARIPKEAHDLLHEYVDDLYKQNSSQSDNQNVNQNTNQNNQNDNVYDEQQAQPQDSVQNATPQNTQQNIPQGKTSDIDSGLNGKSNSAVNKSEPDIVPTYQTTDDDLNSYTSDLNSNVESDNEKKSYGYYKPQQSLLPFSSKRIKYNFTPFHSVLEIINKKANREQLSPEEENIYNEYRGIFNYSNTFNKILIAIGKYLEDKKAFKYVDNGNVKEGDVVGFMIDKELNSKAGDVVVLITKNGQVIGNLPSLQYDKRTIENTPGLKEFLTNIISQWSKSGKITAESRVDKFMIGQIPFIKERHTLNDIYEKKPFYIGISYETNVNVKLECGALKDKTMRVLKAKKGQAFLLFETGASGNRTYIPVPFTMDRLNSNTANTILAKLIKGKIESLVNYDNKSVVNILNEFRELLSVREFHVNYLDNGNIQMSFVDYNNVRHEFFNQPAANIGNAFNELLKENVSFQISSKYINGTLNGMNYNRLIGEIAKTNLDIGSTHTISNWFTINPIGADYTILDAQSPRSIRENPNHKTSVNIDWNGNKLSVNLNEDKVFNNDGTEYNGNDKLEILAFTESKQEGKTNPYKSKYAGEGKLFDPNTKKFVNTPTNSDDVMESFDAGLEHHSDDIPTNLNGLFAEVEKMAKDREQKKEQKEWSPEKQQKTIKFAESFYSYFDDSRHSILNDYKVPKEDKHAEEIVANVTNIYFKNLELDFDTAREFLSILKKYNPERYNNVKQSFLNNQKNQQNTQDDQKASNDRYEIKYSPDGKERQTFYVKGSHIYNESGEEVYKEGVPDRKNNRNKIYANLAIRQGRAKVVEYRDKKYVVNSRGEIMSVATGKIMEWQANNGNRKSILALAQTIVDKNGNVTQLFGQPVKNSQQENIDNDNKSNNDNSNLNEGIQNPQEEDSIVDTFDDLINQNEVSAAQKIFTNNPEQSNNNQQNDITQNDLSKQSPDNIKKIAEENGIIKAGEDSEKVWDALNPEQQSKIIGYSKLKQKKIMLRLIDSYDKGKFNSNILNGSLDSFIDSPKFRIIDSTEPSETFNLKNELAWLKNVLPQFSDEEHLMLINGLTKMGTNIEVYGMFARGIIFLNSKTQTRGTVYHEAFHAVFNTLLTDEEIKAVYEAGVKKFNKTGIALEEALAEDFRKYTQGIEYKDKGKGLIKYWRKLVSFIKRLFGKEDVLNQLYSDINKGLYADRIPKVTDAIRFNDKEMEDIRKQAIADGRIKLKADGSFDYALAPNGKRSNLNERQWLQVRTKAFKDWFGDWINNPANASKVVDENGEPLVVYHGTPNKFTTFDKEKIGSTTDYGVFGTGFYFALTTSYAKKYSDNVNSFFLNIRNPYYGVDAGGVLNNKEYQPRNVEDAYNSAYENAIKRGKSKENATRIAEKTKQSAININNKNTELLKGNYDGVDATGEKVNYSEKQFIAFEPNQIKSATDNIGIFSRDNDDVRYREVSNQNNEITNKEIIEIRDKISRINNSIENMPSDGSFKKERKLLTEERDNLMYQIKQMLKQAEYREWLSDFNNLSEQDKQALNDVGLTEKDWNELDDDGRENALMCYGVF